MSYGDEQAESRRLHSILKEGEESMTAPRTAAGLALDQSLDEWSGLRNAWTRNILAIEAEAAALTPGALPPEAIEWARELMRQGYTDEHIVTFSETGYGLQHPIRCRPDLIGCQFNEWLATELAPDEEPGRYVMTWAKDGPRYARLSAGQAEDEGL